jgi:Putative transposase
MFGRLTWINIQSFEDKGHFLKYAGRYTRRPPIAEHRITPIADRTVTFWYKDKKLHRKVEVQCSKSLSSGGLNISLNATSILFEGCAATPGSAILIVRITRRHVPATKLRSSEQIARSVENQIVLGKVALLRGRKAVQHDLRPRATFLLGATIRRPKAPQDVVLTL